MDNNHDNNILTLTRMLMDPIKYKDIDIIQFIKKNNIHVDTDLPSMCAGLYMPIIYHCCSREIISKTINDSSKSIYVPLLFNYLIKNGVNVNKPMLCDLEGDNLTKIAPYPMDLLMYSRIEYVSLLKKYGCIFTKERIPEYCRLLIINGNIKKLLIFNKYDLISSDDILDVLKNTEMPFIIIDNMVNKMALTSNDTDRKIVIENYIKIFKLYISNNINLNVYKSIHDYENDLERTEHFLQLVLNTYIYELIQLIFGDKSVELPENITLLHYSIFDQKLRNVFPEFYNEEIFGKIKKYISEKTPKRIIKRSYVKKTIINI